MTDTNSLPGTTGQSIGGSGGEHVGSVETFERAAGPGPGVQVASGIDGNGSPTPPVAVATPDADTVNTKSV